MTDRGVSDSDMPTFPWQTRPEAQALDALLSGNCRPEEVPADLRPVAEVLVALQAPPDRWEVAGWGQALTVYREIAGRPEMPGRPRSRRRRPIAPPLGARFAAAAGAAGGADHVTAYCASVPHPGATDPPGRRVGQTISPTDASHGRKPTTPPGKPTTPPGKPTTPPGKPTTPPGNGGGNSNGYGPGK